MGIPCKHIVKICIKYSLAIEPYVQRNWKFRETKMEQKAMAYMMKGLDVPKTGKPKFSNRRNRKTVKKGKYGFDGYYARDIANIDRPLWLFIFA